MHRTHLFPCDRLPFPWHIIPPPSEAGLSDNTGLPRVDVPIYST